MTTPPTDASLLLVQRWRDGDRAALDQLLEGILPWLRAKVHRALGNAPRDQHDTMDIVQSAIANFLSRGPRFLPANGAQLRVLLGRIAINELIDRQRRRARAGGGRHVESVLAPQARSALRAPTASWNDPAAAADKAADRAWVHLALQFLSQQDRYLLLASESEGLDWASIAGELGLASADAARMRCARLKPRVANLLRQLREGTLPEDGAADG
jgi:RNA polymerase sigma factor (sigma-70 family)